MEARVESRETRGESDDVGDVRALEQERDERRETTRDDERQREATRGKIETTLAREFENE